MNIINNIKLDAFSKRTIAAMGIFAAVIVMIFLTDGSAIPSAMRHFCFFIWGISACAVLSLYFDMLGYIFAAAGGNERLIFCIADAAALFLKLLILPRAFPFTDENALFLLFAAFAADVVLSRSHLLYTHRRLDQALSDTNIPSTELT